MLSPGVNEDKLRQLLMFARRLRRDKDETIRMLSSALSTRQLIRICRHLAYFDDENLYKTIHKAALSRFMPTAAKTVLHEVMVANGIYPPKEEIDLEQLQIEVLPSRDNPQQIRIGNVIEPVFKNGDPMLIPNVVFHENPAHTEILREMLKDYQLGMCEKDAYHLIAIQLMHLSKAIICCLLVTRVLARTNWPTTFCSSCNCLANTSNFIVIVRFRA